MTELNRLSALFCLILLGLSIGMVSAQPLDEPTNFVIADVRVEGIQRISAGTVFSYLPVTVGSRITPADYPNIIRSLFQTGFFADVQLRREGNVLVIVVDERPAISEVTLEGNRDISTTDLQTRLRELGLREGEVFNQALLDRVQQALFDLYFARGKYAVRIEPQVRPLVRNRVGINFVIEEGIRARVREIKIIGANAFSERQLVRLLQTTTPGVLTVFTRSDQYSKERLEADLEILQAFYLDRGYLRFAVDSTQVTLTPDRRDIIITINLSEGEVYTLTDIDLVGNLGVEAAQLQPALQEAKLNRPFSRQAFSAAMNELQNLLGNEGYAFARLNPVPNIDDETRTVAMRVEIDAGERALVRQINFQGNVSTQDETLRRELRQLESAPYDRQAIERSRTRLERLRFLSSVDIRNVPVPDQPNQLDLSITVEERPSGSFLFGVGYGDIGVVLTASFTEENFFGTGNRLNLAFNNSRVDRTYLLNFEQPYYTLDGISRGLNFSYQETDFSERNSADYSTDNLLTQITFGFPLNETDTINTGIGFSRVKVNFNEDLTATEILDEIRRNGDTYNNPLFTLSYARDSRNRAIFPTRGSLNSIAGEFTFPGSTSQYYKLSYRHASYYSLLDPITLSLRANLAHGDGYGSTDSLPFFEKYFAGGLTTVRGYRSNTLGPRFESTGEPSGGSTRVTGGAEAIFPLPFLENAQAFRLFAFTDIGNVFNGVSDVRLGELRTSAGVGARWFSPFGPISLNFARPLNSRSGDDTEYVQFSFGIPF